MPDFRDAATMPGYAARALILTRLWARTPCPVQIRAPSVGRTSPDTHGAYELLMIALPSPLTTAHLQHAYRLPGWTNRGHARPAVGMDAGDRIRVHRIRDRGALINA